MTLEPVAYFRSPYGDKFGIPRQGGLVDTPGEVVFTGPYRDDNAVRGLDGFDYVWLLWGFSENRGTARAWQPTVRPPRLGGNAVLGVFATRSPYRPNPIGLTAVRLERIAPGPILHVRGADLVDGTPVYDIKPYVRYADARPDALSGFADEAPRPRLDVRFDVECPLGADLRDRLAQVLALDPRPAYKGDGTYHLRFGGYDVAFTVTDGLVRVTRFGADAPFH